MIEGSLRAELLRAFARARSDVDVVENLVAGDASCLEVLARTIATAQRLEDAVTAVLDAHAAEYVPGLGLDDTRAHDLLDIAARRGGRTSTRQLMPSDVRELRGRPPRPLYPHRVFFRNREGD